MPAHTLPSEQLALRHILVGPLRIIQDTRLDDDSTRERFTCAVQRRAAIGAEMGSDVLACIGDLGNSLRLAYDRQHQPTTYGKAEGTTRLELEVVLRNDNVVAVASSRNLSAV